VVERLDHRYLLKFYICWQSVLHLIPRYLLKFHFANMFCLSYLHFCDAAEKLGEVWRLRQGNSKDPLLDVVDVLESNWKLARDVLQQTRHVLIRMFVGLFSKKRNEMPVDNL
jgi:hypothetical protein